MGIPPCKTTFGGAPLANDHTVASLMTIFSLRSGHLTASFLARGATLHKLCLAGSATNMVIGFSDPEDHAAIPVYAGALVGPVANRVAGGRAQIDGKACQMPLNEDARTTLHSGPCGLHGLVWSVEDHREDRITFALTLPDGACGLPGNRHIRATYTLEDATLILRITASSDRTTLMNIAAHPYWNLDGGGDVGTHQLALATARYLATNANALPTGEITLAKGGPFDFRNARPVPLDPALDVNFCLSEQPFPRPEHAATLVGSRGIRLDLSTTAPGLQVYNGAFLPQRCNILTDGGDLVPFGGIALEPQHWPDAPNQPGFPSILLPAGGQYEQITAYRFSAA